MAMRTLQREGRYVHANGIDIHYVEAGAGEPLLLLDNAMVSTNPVWASRPFAYASFTGTLAEHFRVITPDARGYIFKGRLMPRACFSICQIPKRKSLKLW